MANPSDWEKILNDAFRKGGRPNFGPEDLSPLDGLTEALQRQQKELDARIQAQTRALQDSDAAVQKALEESRRMVQDMEKDGLLTQGTSQVPPAQQGSFVGLADAVREKVLGQDAFVDSLVRAMRRPFVLGTERENAKKRHPDQRRHRNRPPLRAGM